MKTLSIIIPAYSEAHRIKKSIEMMKLFHSEWIQKWPGIKLEIIYVVEKSPDQTLEIAQTMASDSKVLKVIANSIHRGKGYAVRTGMLNSVGDVKLFMDLDLSTDLSHVKEFYDDIASNKFDIVIGNRKGQDSKITLQQSVLRRMASFVFNKIVSTIWLQGIKDSQCGFKAFSKKSANYLFNSLHFDGYTFDVEIIYKAKLLSLRIKSFPVIWNDDKGSKVRLFYHSFQIIKDLFYLQDKFQAMNFIHEYQKIVEEEKGNEEVSHAA
jgi:glycosyltransferase involved in cell wall biosynthesis